MILLDDKYVIVKYQEDTKCIYYKWKGFVPTVVLKRTMENIITWIEQYQADSMISNLKDMGAVSKEDQEWVAHKFTTVLLNLTIIYSAVVLPSSIFGNFANDEIVKNISSGKITIRNFGDEKKAIEWIEEFHK